MEAILKEALTGSINSMLKIACIVIPLMVVMELAREADLLERSAKLFRPLTALLGVSPAATFPLLAGLVFGLVYGSGLIIRSVREGKIPAAENYLLNIFLSICHGMIEDTLLFLAVGASAVVIIGVRLAAGVAITRLLACLLIRRSHPTQRLELG
ncbi:nucleoside recognition domain containing protein [Thermacetogenium phaeum DSM 12270]|uniref:Nucleoside recognition domain containing protein n=1 Tax=Thermacetogenium phaeum (strain ATCC BAA-254 / DSM 26808 / PB) TaxID=1089553 RepID=K4LVM9_THEPS|nr:nucleoside recognition domain-containing protein [Thermacetogenium phaeum]AFV12069.1 nucleoside recognition domain containing protein [Thermacetogenium phaeum DSM 12270]